MKNPAEIMRQANEIVEGGRRLIEENTKAQDIRLVYVTDDGRYLRYAADGEIFSIEAAHFKNEFYPKHYTPELIAHRGIYSGEGVENHPEQITMAMSNGYSVEIDVRVDEENRTIFHSGHDGKQFLVDFGAIYDTAKQNNVKVYFHAKNFRTRFALKKLFEERNYASRMDFFSHETDEYTITHRGRYWFYPQKFPLPPQRPPKFNQGIMLKPKSNYEVVENLPDAICTNNFYELGLSPKAIRAV